MSQPSTVIPFNPELGDKGVHTFSKGISLKVIIIIQLEFELAYFGGEAPVLEI